MRWRSLLSVTVVGATVVVGCSTNSSDDSSPASTVEAGEASSTGEAQPDPVTTAPATDAPAATAAESDSPATTAPETDAGDPTGSATVSGQLLAVYQPAPGCAEGEVVPLGQAPGARNFEPLGSIWCFDLSAPPEETVEEGANSWVDDFDVGCPIDAPEGCTSMMSLADGQMRYRAFDETGSGPPEQAQHWINQNHWMADVQGGFTGGSSIRPDRSFRFEDGMLVVEGDFAAGIPEYGGETWGEITITTAPEPTGDVVDILYAYGQFGGHYAVGCRLPPFRSPVCAVMGPEADSPPAEGQCSALPGNYRVIEVSWHQKCGSDTFGGDPSLVDGEPWRECEPEGIDMACRDRFRMEVTKDSLTLYVNGVLYFEDANWPAAYQLPDSFVDGEIYAYQSNWQHRAGDRAFRYHWDRFAVNPPTGPTASDTFG